MTAAMSENQAPKGATTSASADSVLPAEVREALRALYRDADDASSEIDTLRSALLAAYGERKPVEDEDVERVLRTLRRCTCHDDYKVRRMRDPECEFHSGFGEEAADLIERLARERDEARARADEAEMLVGQHSEAHDHAYMRMQSAEEALAAERSRAAELEADAERYRFLRHRYMAADFDWGDLHESVLIFAWPATATVSASCDATIDAARAALTPKETKE